MALGHLVISLLYLKQVYYVILISRISNELIYKKIAVSGRGEDEISKYFQLKLYDDEQEINEPSAQYIPQDRLH